METKRVTLVDENDKEQGSMEKLEAHRKGVLHRAFSIFIFNRSGELLLQKRADMKYHSGGLWTNTCCGHPLPGEAVNESAMRRLQEEMGFECLLLPAFLFTYKAELDQGLIEYEYDHVLIGYHNMPPIPDPDEVSEWKYEALTVIKEQLDVEPTVFTPWFRIAFPKVLNYLAEKNTEMQINR